MYRVLNQAFARLIVLGLASACAGTPSNVASNDHPASGGTGGQTPSGGSSAAGGSPASGGARDSTSGSDVGGTNGFGGSSGTGGSQATGGSSNTKGSLGTGGKYDTGGVSSVGGIASIGGTLATGGMQTSGGAAGGSTKAAAGGSVTGGANAGGTKATGGNASSGGVSATGGANAMGGTAVGTTTSTSGHYPFPQQILSAHCTYPRNAKNDDVQAAYDQWKTAVITSDGAGGFQRVKKPDSGSVIGSTVSEGIGYGMILAVYMNDQSLFDNLWKYEQSHLDSSGLMNWEIGPDNVMTSGGAGGATDGDEDMAWALIMADRQWGANYLNSAKELIDAIWNHEVDHNRGEMLKPGDQWGDVDVTNPSYFAPAYYRVFGQVTGKEQDWNKVIDSSYSIIEKSLNAASGNQDNGLVPAWCDSKGTPVEAFSGAPKNFQNDSTRTPFRVGQDYCYFGEPRAQAYLAKISAFYASVGVANIVNGYDLNGKPNPDKVYAAGLQAASFVGPAGVGAMSDPQYQQMVDDAYAKLATLQLTAGTIYYQKSWTALSLLMLTGNLVNFAAQ